MDNRLYWIWFQSSIEKDAGAKANSVISFFGSLPDFYRAGAREWRGAGIFTEKELHRLKKVPLSNSSSILDKCNKLGYNVVTPDDKGYPARLLSIYNYPCALYVWGDMGNIDDEVCIAVVGTRTPSQYGIEVAYRLCMGLSRAGAVIVSGGAYGIDTQAHQGALAAGGKTIAVLGCGINVNYLSENRDLRNVISKNGAVISEYPPGTPVRPYHFPVRNRIISGLSLGTIVVEASVKSGALITATHAAEQGRDVFAVPGSVMSEHSGGTNKLLSDGAKPVMSVYDVMEEYAHLFPHKINLEGADFSLSVIKGAQKENHNMVAQKRADMTLKDKPARKKDTKKLALPDDISENAKKVYLALGKEAVHVDDLSKKLSMQPNEVLQSLTELELYSLVEAMSGRRFCAKYEQT